ncbi:hypothetical protein FRB94_004021 [Tulasnella sp. JGI-2019a]|nr:hypothetical protein FRB94_004021 [Tulasnella sp. JGI-2019a]
MIGTALADEGSPRSRPELFTAKKTDLFTSFRDRLADHFKIPAQNIRFWILNARENKTRRPGTLIRDEDLELLLGTIRRKKAGSQADLCLYLKLLPESTRRGIAAPPPNQRLLSFKYFNAEEQTITGAFKVLVDVELAISHLCDIICKRMRWPHKMQLRL